MTKPTLIVRAALLFGGILNLVIGLYSFFMPNSFAGALATFLPFNLHLFHDIGGIPKPRSPSPSESWGKLHELLVSSSMPPPVAGSGIDFDDRGARALKWRPG